VSSAKLRVLRGEPRGSFQPLGAWTLGFVATRRVAFDFGRQQLTGRGCVTDGGLGVESEHDGKMQWVGPVGKGFLELAVDAKAFQGRGLLVE
jgi:hypothetical protein